MSTLEKSGGSLERGRRPLTEIDPHIIASARERCVRVMNTFIDGVTNGSGVIIETDLVLTNFHVIELLGDITVNDNPAKLLWSDWRNDIAALVVHTRRLRRVSFNTKLYRQMPVFYVGNPDGCNKTVVRGHICYSNMKEKQIRADAPCDEGYSGSGLFDARSGALVGLNDSMVAGGKRYDMTMSIPAEIVLKFLKQEVFPRFYRRPKLVKPQENTEPRFF